MESRSPKHLLYHFNPIKLRKEIRAHSCSNHGKAPVRHFPISGSSDVLVPGRCGVQWKHKEYA